MKNSDILNIRSVTWIYINILICSHPLFRNPMHRLSQTVFHLKWVNLFIHSKNLEIYTAKQNKKFGVKVHIDQKIVCNQCKKAY